MRKETLSQMSQLLTSGEFREKDAKRIFPRDGLLIISWMCIGGTMKSALDFNFFP